MSEEEQGEDNKEVKKCLICKPAGDLSTEEIPYWSKKEGNYSPYPKMITCDAKYALEQRDDMVEESPTITDKEIELKMDFGEEVSEKWVFYFASKPQGDPLIINPPKEAYGQDENHGLAKTDKKGKVSFKLNCPQPYRIEDITYCRHVHYLVEEEGVWSSLRTTRVICEIELEELDKILKEKTALVINALDFKYYDKDKIPGSVNLPSSQLEKLDSEKKEKQVVDFLKENVSKLKSVEEKVKSKKLDIKDIPIVTYCANAKCKTSQKLIDHLYECNVNNVLEWSSGMDGWQKERTFFVGDSDEEEKEEKSDSDSSSDSDKESSDSSSDSESDEDETTEVVYEGVTYLYDIQKKELCDEEAEIVATADFEDGEIKNVKWKPSEQKKHEKNSDYEEASGTDEEEDEEEEEEDEEEEEAEEEEESDQTPKPSKKQKRVKIVDSDSEEYEGEEDGKVEQSDGGESEEDEVETGAVFNYKEDELYAKKVKELKDLVIKMTERKGSYSFPLGRKGYRTKGQIINLIQTCQGKSKSKNDQFDYFDEHSLYSMKLGELKDHVEEMITRDKGSYKFALSGFKKSDLVDLILACQGSPKQTGGSKKYKGHGWGFTF